MRNENKIIDYSSFIDPTQRNLRERLRMTYELRRKVEYTEDVIELLGFLKELLKTLEDDSAMTAALICKRIEEVFKNVSI